MYLQSPIFQNQVVIVTGSGRGIGQAVALAFAREGARVVASDSGVDLDGTGGDSTVVNQVVEQIVAAGGQAVAHAGSMTDEGTAEALIRLAVEHFGRADVLVHCAGVHRPASLVEMRDDDWVRVLDAHLSGAFACSRAFARYAIDHGRKGRIVNLLAAPLRFEVEGFGPNAVAAAMGGAGFTRAIARELEPHGITVNAVAPLARTRMTQDMKGVGEDMQVDQVAAMVLYLASEAAGEVTGEVFGVHGQHLFAYKLKATPGVKKYGSVPWTANQVNYRMADIRKEPQPRKPPNPALKSSSAPAPAPAAPAMDVAAQPITVPKRKSTRIEDEPFLPPAPGATSSDPVERTFGLLPLGFRQSKAVGKSFHVYFDLEDGPGHTVILQEGQFRVEKGKVGEPRCVVKGPADVVVGMFTGTVNAEKAFVSGQLSATNLAELMALGMVLDPRKARLAFEKGLVPEPMPAEEKPEPSPEKPGEAEPDGSDPVSAVFSKLPLALVPEKAEGKAFNIYFDVKGGASQTLTLENGELRVRAGKQGTPTCIVRTDAETIVGVFSGKIKAEAAFMQGRFSATNLADMVTMNQVLSVKKALAAMKGGESPTPAGEKAEPSPEKPGEAEPDGSDPVSAVFSKLPLALVPEKAEGKAFNIYFDVKGGASQTLTLENGELRVRAGKQGTPTCIVRTDAETIVGVFSGKIKPEAAFMQGRFSATNLNDMMTLNQVISFKRVREGAR